MTAYRRHKIWSNPAIMLAILIPVNFFANTGNQLALERKQEIDSLITLTHNTAVIDKSPYYNRIALVYLTYNPFYTEIYAKAAFHHAGKNNNTYEKAMALYTLSGLSGYKNEYFRAIKLIKSSIQLFPENDEMLVKSYLQLSLYYLMTSKIDSLRKYIARAYAYTKSLDDSLIFAHYYYMKAKADEALNFPDSAMRNYLKAVNIFEKYDKNKQIIDILCEVSKIYINSGKYKQAKALLNHAVNLAEKEQNKLLQVKVFIHLGFFYTFTDTTYEKTLYFNETALKLASEINDQNSITSLYNNLATIYRQKEKYEKAMDYFFRYLGNVKKVKSEKRIAIAYHNIGMTFFDMRHTDTALFYFRKSIKTAEKVGYYDIIIENYKILYHFYENQADFHKAMDYYKKYTTLQDSVFTISSRQKLGEYQIQFENRLKNTKQQVKLLEKSQKANRLLRWAIIVTILMVFSITIYIFTIFRKNKEVNELLRELNDELEKHTTELAETNKIIEHTNRKANNAINHARQIQDAIIPSGDQLKKVLPSSFVISSPRDIISGDFYWYAQQDNKIYLALADGTGHGVPAAFMAMTGYTLLNEIITIHKAEKPSEILLQLDNAIKRIFEEQEAFTRKDILSNGMDISLCCIDYDSNEFIVSTANQTVYLVMDENLHRIDGTPTSIGEVIIERQESFFEESIFPLRKGIQCYLFSDGYIDQFGQQDNTKFSRKRLEKTIINIHKKPVQEQAAILKEAFYEWKGANRQTDDMMIIGFRIS